MKSLPAVVALISLGIWARFAFDEIPNFAPVSSVALFAGYLVCDRRWALTVPFCIMAVTDQVIGSYQIPLMLTVYGTLAVPAFWGEWARRRWPIRGDQPVAALSSVVKLCGSTFAAAVLFFFTTNFMTWMVTPWYEKSLSGLALCFARAAEFFPHTLAGNLIFAVALFGAYAVGSIAVWNARMHFARQT